MEDRPNVGNEVHLPIQVDHEVIAIDDEDVDMQKRILNSLTATPRMDFLEMAQREAVLAISRGDPCISFALTTLVGDTEKSTTSDSDASVEQSDAACIRQMPGDDPSCAEAICTN